MRLAVPLWVGGRFDLAHFAPNGRPLWRRSLANGVTVQGVDHLLDVGFRNQAAFAVWYIGLIDNAGYSALSAADTHEAHAGWSEFTSLYTGLRPAWDPAAAAGGHMTAATQAQVQVTAPGTVRGAFLASRAAVGAAAGHMLYCTAAADSGLAVVAGGIVRASYTLRLRPPPGSP